MLRGSSAKLKKNIEVKVGYVENTKYIPLFFRGEPAEKWPYGTLVKVEIWC
jgi:hypothetical protein